MPRPNKPRTIGAEDRLRDTIRRFMEDNERGATWFARRMQDYGCESFTNATLAKILNGGRTIYAIEGIAMAAVMNLPVDEVLLAAQYDRIVSTDDPAERARANRAAWNAYEGVDESSHG